MNKKTWILIIGIVLILCGGAICCSVFFLNGRALPQGTVQISNNGKVQFTNSDYEKKTYEVGEAFSSLDICGAQELDVKLEKSTTGKNYVEYYDMANLTHSVSVKNKTLYVSVDDQRGGISVSFSNWIPTITIYLTEDDLNQVRIQTSSGDILVQEKFNIAIVDLTCSSGDVIASNLKGEQASFYASSGDIELDNITYNQGTMKTSSGSGKIRHSVVDEFHASASSGDIELQNLSTDKLKFETSSGSTQGETVIAKTSVVGKATSGDIELEDSASGSFDLTASSGSIEVGLSKGSYNIQTSTSSGDVDVPQTKAGADGTFTLKTSSGDITVYYQ